MTRFASSTAHSTQASTSSTPPTPIPTGSPRLSSEKRCRRSIARTSSSPPRSTSPPAIRPTRTPRATHDAGSLPSATTAFVVSALTTSTSTKFTVPDESTDIDETLGALSDLVHQGKIRYFGSSTFPGGHLVEAQWVSEKRNLGRFVTEQPPYSILVRGIERDILPLTQKYGMGVIPWSPLAGGWLSGALRRRQGQHQPSLLAPPGRYDMSHSCQPGQARRRQSAHHARRRRRSHA